MENKQSLVYKTILQNVILLRAIILVVQSKGEVDSLSSTQAKVPIVFFIKAFKQYIITS